VPFVLAVGMWALAALTTVTFGQRVLVVRRAAGPRARSDQPPGGGQADERAGGRAGGPATG
jgi:hypothetical protein